MLQYDANQKHFAQAEVNDVSWHYLLGKNTQNKSDGFLL